MDETKKTGVSPSQLAGLKEFFPEDALEWLPKSLGKDNGEYWVLVIPYMNRTAVMERLDSVLGPQNWRDEYHAGPNGGVMCGLSIRINGEWITKYDGAENTNIEAIKGGISDAFKRVATKWGIGRYLSQFPMVYGIINLKHGKKRATYKPKKGENEYFKYDIPPVPLEWLPCPGESEDVKKMRAEIEQVLKRIPENTLPADKKVWLDRKLSTFFTEGEAKRALSGLKVYITNINEPQKAEQPAQKAPNNQESAGSGKPPANQPGSQKATPLGPSDNPFIP